MSEATKIGLRDFIVALVTAVASITGSYFLFVGQSKQADAEMVRTLYEQVQQLQKDLFEAQSQIVELKIELSKKHESAQILKDFLDGMDNPAWIKLVDESHGQPEFPNWHINNAYERMFGVSAAKYVGKTDFEVWPHETAAKFYANDLTTFERMSSYCLRETFPKTPNSSIIVSGHVCKWVTFINGRVAVAGQVLIDPNNLKEVQK